MRKIILGILLGAVLCWTGVSMAQATSRCCGAAPAGDPNEGYACNKHEFPNDVATSGCVESGDSCAGGNLGSAHGCICVAGNCSSDNCESDAVAGCQETGQVHPAQ
jgi:hypothetical protein